MASPKYPEPHIDSRRQSSKGRGSVQDVEDVQSNIEIKLTPPTPTGPLFPEFVHLRTIKTPNTSDHSVRGGRIWLSPDFEHTEPIPNYSLPSFLSTTVFGSQTSSSVTYNQDTMSVRSKPLPPIPEPCPWAESAIQTPVNALIPNRRKAEDQTELFTEAKRISMPYTLSSTPGLPIRNSKRLKPYGSIGEMFKQWGRTPELEGRSYKRLKSSTPDIPLRSSRRLLQFGSIGEILGKRSNTPHRNFDQGSEVSEWIKILKEKAGVTVESIQNPPPPTQYLFSISSDECEKAVKPYRCPYLVIKLAENDTNQIPTWKRRLRKVAPLSCLLAISAYVTYIILRIMYTVSAKKAGNEYSGLSWVFIAVEIGLTFPLIFHQFWQAFIPRAGKPAKLRIISDFTPNVDVFITCCNEAEDIILDTVRAALAVSWPIARFRVILLDDGASSSLQAEIERLFKRFPNLYYTARRNVPGPSHRFKAGNLNHGLRFVEELNDGAGEFCAVLDANMIVEQDWLRAMLAHIVTDEDVALVCPPERFYNVPKNDSVGQGLSPSAQSNDSIKEKSSITWRSGSGCVVRRFALDECGGFPPDMTTSSMLLGAGWKTASVHESLQSGTMPDSFMGCVNHRTRETISTIETARKLNFFLCGSQVLRMSFFQRICGFIHAISSFYSLFVLFSLLLIPISILAGKQIVAFGTSEELRWLIRAFFLLMVLSRINAWILSLSSREQKSSHASLWIIPYEAVAIVRYLLLPKWLGGKTPPSNSPNVTHSSQQASLLTRLATVLTTDFAIFHLAYIIISIAALATSIQQSITYSHNLLQTLRAITPIFYQSTLPSGSTITEIYLITHTFWAPLLIWISGIVMACVPIGRAVWPPVMTERRDLLLRDGQGVWRVRGGEERRGKWMVWRERLLGWGLVLNVVAIFVGSWLS